MSITDKINLGLSISSFVLAVLSIVFVVLTIRQNSKMIEESTRPNIVIYGRVTNFGGLSYYLVLKNYGNSGATITKFTYSKNLSDFSLQRGQVPFSLMEGIFIAPGQSVISNIDALKIRPDMDPFKFDISYKTKSRTYHDHFVVMPSADVPNVQARVVTKENELKNISFTLQDLVEKLL